MSNHEQGTSQREGREESLEAAARAVRFGYNLFTNLFKPVVGHLPTFQNDSRTPFGRETVEKTVGQCRRDGGKLVTSLGVIEGEDRMAVIEELDKLLKP